MGKKRPLTLTGAHYVQRAKTRRRETPGKVARRAVRLYVSFSQVPFLLREAKGSLAFLPDKS